MKIARYMLGVCLVLISGLSQAQTTTGSDGWTLEECLNYAIENNEQLKISQFDEEIAQAQIGQIRAQGLPQIAGGIGYTNNIAIQQQVAPDFLSPVIGRVLLGVGSINQPQLDVIDAQADTTFFGLALGTTHAGFASVQLDQLIFDGTYFVGLQAARTFKDLSAVQTDRTREQVVEGVTKAYYGVLVNEERLTLLERNLERLESLVSDTEKLYKEGFAEKIDVSRLKVNRNNLITEYQKLKDFVGISYDLLKFQMGMPVTEPIALSLSLAQITIEDEEAMDEEEFNFSQRTDYMINKVNQELVALDLKNVRAGYLPSLRGNVQAGLNNGANNFLEITEGDDAGPGLFTNDWLEFASVNLTLSVPIFDGLLKANQAQEKKLQAEQLQLQQRLLENNISLEIKQAKTNYQNNLASLEWQKENMELAREVIVVSEAKYREGLGSNLEVVEANTSLKEAQTNYYAAVYDLLISQVELRKALGLLNN